MSCCFTGDRRRLERKTRSDYRNLRLSLRDNRDRVGRCARNPVALGKRDHALLDVQDSNFEVDSDVLSATSGT